MKIIQFLAPLICLPVVVNSQVSLNGTMTPPINTKLIYYDANVPSPPFIFSKTGTNNTWNFSTITPVAGLYDTTFVVAPSSVPLSSNFPTATHCVYEAAATPFYTMLKIDNIGIYLIGAIADVANNGTLFALKPNVATQTMAFPYTYGSTGTGSGYTHVYTSGSSVGQPTIDSIHFKVTVTGSHTVIASGDMILPAPTGTMPAILERTNTTRVDSVWVKDLITLFQWVLAPGYPTTSIDSGFHWYTNNSLFPYANATYNSTGLTRVNYFKSGTAVSLSEMNVKPIVNIYPNPVTDILQFDFRNFKQGNIDFRIYNSSGQKVWYGRTTFPSIDVSVLKQGLYFLELIDDSGNISSKRFVKG